ncbi:MAG: response regulator [Candidatus Moraniibacteriota bacterium]|nr:MAG: response regulator [Candidatus Moranbacteria bacterium]
MDIIMISVEKKILIVEDDDSLRRAVVEKLSREGFIALQANNGLAGLECAFQEHPDLILLDVIMPKMDGLTMLSRLREDVWGKSAQVIMLTNVSDGESVLESLNQAAFDYLVKSDWKLEDVVKKIRERLEK